MVPELTNAVSRMGVSRSKSTPYRHTSNPTCEKAARKVVEGARSLLEHAGLPSCFWPFAVRFWCFMANTEVTAGESAWSLRRGMGHFPAKRYPFGRLVDFFPT